MTTSRLSPPYADLADAVAAGALGTVVFARFTRVGAPPHHGRDTALADIVMAQLLEDIEHSLRIVGPVTRVHSRFTSEPRTLPATSQLVMSHRGGAISHVVATWLPDSEARTTYLVTGTGGSLSHDSVSSASIRTRWSSGERHSKGSGANTNVLAAILDHQPDPEVRAVAEAAAQSAASGRAVLIGGHAGSEVGES